MLHCECMSGRRLGHWEFVVCVKAVGMPPVSHTTNYPPGLGIAMKVCFWLLCGCSFALAQRYSSTDSPPFFECRLLLVATNACSPGWSRLLSQVLRVAMWASTPRGSVVTTPTPTWSVSVYSNHSWELPAAQVAIHQPGHRSTSLPVCSLEWPLEGAVECNLLLSGQLSLHGIFFSFVCVCVYMILLFVN